jgi:hypothetical protein
VSLRLDRRMIPKEDQVEQRLKAVIRGAVKDLPGIRAGVRRLLLARALAPSRVTSVWPRFSGRAPRQSCASPSRSPPRPSIPMRASMLKEACPSFSIARVHAQCWRPTPSALSRTFSWRTSSAQPSWSGRYPICCALESCSACETGGALDMTLLRVDGSSMPTLARGSERRLQRDQCYSETALGGKARVKNAQCAALVVRALRPIIPKKKIVKPHAVRRNLRARMTGSLDRTRHTDGEDNARGGEPFQGRKRSKRCARAQTGTLAIQDRCGRLLPA